MSPHWDLSGDTPQLVNKPLRAKEQSVTMTSLLPPERYTKPSEPVSDTTGKAIARVCANPECGRTFWDHRKNVKYHSLDCQRQENLRKAAISPSARRSVRESQRRRKAASYKALGAHTDAQWIEKLEASGHLCHYCGCHLTKAITTRDHYVPLSRGGSDDIENIVPACRRCNCRKGSLTGDEFIANLRRIATHEEEGIDRFFQPPTTSSKNKNQYT